MNKLIMKLFTLQTSHFSGVLMELVLIFEWIMITFFLEITLYFVLRIRGKKNELRTLQEKAYIFLFLGYSLMWIFITISDFYLSNESIRIYLLNIGYLCEIVCTVIFIYILETYRNFYKPYIFTQIFSIFIGLYVFFFIFFIEYAPFFSSIFWIIFMVFFFKFTNELYHNFYVKRELSMLKYNFFELLFGIIFVSFGYQLTTRFLVETFGLLIRLLGDVFQIIGAILLFIFFLSIPSFSEYDWDKEMESVILMYKSGLLIYHKRFSSNEDNEIKMNYFSGVLVSMKIMFKNLIQTDETSIIKREGKYVILKTGKYVYGALICNKNLDSLHILLERFIERVELIFSTILENWNGNLQILKPIENIAKEIFEFS
jgi:hypothetical protein